MISHLISLLNNGQPTVTVAYQDGTHYAGCKLTSAGNYGISISQPGQGADIETFLPWATISALTIDEPATPPAYQPRSDADIGEE